MRWRHSLPTVAMIVALAGCSRVGDSHVEAATGLIPLGHGQATHRLSTTETPLLWVADGSWVTGYLLSDNGDVFPTRLIEGPNTQIFDAEATGTGPDGELFVLISVGGKKWPSVWEVLRFRAGADGDVAPGDIINCQINNADDAFAVNQSGKIAVVDLTGDPPGSGIDVVPPGSVGCSKGYEFIGGSNAQIVGGPGAAFGPHGDIVTTNNFEAAVVFDGDQFGNVSPKRVIQGPHTKLDSPTGYAVDSSGRIYVTNLTANSVAVFASTANGDVNPIRLIRGPNTQLYNPTGIAVAADGRVFVANQQSNSISVYGPDATGNATPIQVISGSATGLQVQYRTQISIAE